jgi:hemolysin activation/secretion protein
MNAPQEPASRRSFTELAQSTLRIAAQGALVLLASHPALAQVRPNAGDVARDVAPTDILSTPPGKTSLGPSRDGRARTGAPQDATPIPVRHIRVTGAQLYSSEVLEALVADLEGDARTLAALSDGATRITRFYRAHGWMLAYAYLPAQSIRNGEVEIRVIEGTLSGVRVEVDAHSRLRASVIDARLASVERDAPLSQPQVDRALLLLSDLPGANVNASLAAGARAGQTYLTVRNAATPLVSGELDADNYGSRYTGDARLGGSVNLNSPFGYGEQFSAHLVASDANLYYGRLAGQVPLGSSGLSTGLSITHTQYLLGKDFANLNARGRADVTQWNIAYPLVRTVPFNVIGQFTSEYRDLFNEVGATETDTHERAFHQAFNLLVSGHDALFAGADTQAALRFGTGTLTVLSQPAAAIDAAGAQSAGGYKTFNVDLQRNQRLTRRWSVLLSARAQLASRNLDSYQKFVLGGPDGVRAYPAGEGTGDKGWLASAELSYEYNAMLIPSAFYDVGAVTVNKHPYLDTNNSRMLRGYGFGLRGSRGAFNWSAKLAFRGAEHAQTEPDSPVRGWVQLGWAF